MAFYFNYKQQGEKKAASDHIKKKIIQFESIKIKTNSMNLMWYNNKETTKPPKTR